MFSGQNTPHDVFLALKDFCGSVAFELEKTIL